MQGCKLTFSQLVSRLSIASARPRLNLPAAGGWASASLEMGTKRDGLYQAPSTPLFSRSKVIHLNFACEEGEPGNEAR